MSWARSGEPLKIVASIATVHGWGRVFIQQSSSRRVDPTLPSCCIRPLAQTARSCMLPTERRRSPPEALYELFRDWQRTQTQSSVKALRSPRLQMDVWFCRAQEPMPRGTLLRVEHPETADLLICTLSRARPRHPCLHLTDDYMDVGNPYLGLFQGCP